MEVDAARSSLYALAYDEARHAVSTQHTVVDNFRSRAGLLLSGAAIATSFLGGQALRSGDPGAWSWIAIGAFLLLGIATLAILWPRSWRFEADPRDIITTYVETDDPASLQALHRDLALHRADVLDVNGRRLTRLIWSFRAAGFLLIFEIVAWAIDLATRS